MLEASAYKVSEDFGHSWMDLGTGIQDICDISYFGQGGPHVIYFLTGIQ
jgi:hypothetical protein